MREAVYGPVWIIGDFFEEIKIFDSFILIDDFFVLDLFGSWWALIMDCQLKALIVIGSQFEIGPIQLPTLTILLF